jgi:hypothetical protein
MAINHYWTAAQVQTFIGVHPWLSVIGAGAFLFAFFVLAVTVEWLRSALWQQWRNWKAGRNGQ